MKWQSNYLSFRSSAQQTDSRLCREVCAHAVSRNKARCFYREAAVQSAGEGRSSQMARKELWDSTHLGPNPGPATCQLYDPG